MGRARTCARRGCAGVFLGARHASGARARGARRSRGSAMKARRGVALMLVLWLIVILTTITTGIALTTRSNSEITANYRAGVVARYAAESGVNVAVAVLEDSIAKLGDGAGRQNYLNRLERALGPAEKVSLGDARLAIALIDVGARLDVNAADVSALTRLFTYFTDGIAAE